MVTYSKHIIQCLLVVLSSFALHAQDVHLSQFYTADQLLNPARMGAHGSDLRFSGNYRNQWKQVNSLPLTTYVVSGDKLLHFGKEDVNVGATVVRDQFSGYKTITNKLLLTGSYGYKWLGNQFRGGIQFGLVTNSTDLSLQTFPNQWNYPNGSFDKDIPNGEQNIRPSQNYLDINSGVTWSRLFGEIKVESGLGFNHINRPKDTYFNTAFEKRKIRGVFHTTASIPVTPFWTLEPKMQWMWTTKANDFLFGSLGRYKTTDPLFTAVFAGLMYRHGVNRTFDAVYPVVGIVFKEFEIGLSYDFNVSTLSDGVKRLKSAEVSIIYTMAPSTVKYKILPCDRY
ncbi:MAG: PorP/SprF family type IX secretion system membrane protein [Bacteroidetes bacterium]|nr:PorP/SprF family type IX secretion system membrane protein [Bacteroidota bacterium]